MIIDIEERAAKAKRLFKEGGYNCCQAVVLAYNDIFGLDDKTAASLASGFGGGMGRLREVCGSVSGMVFLSGLISPADDPSDKEVLGLVPMGSGDKTAEESPVPSDRTAEYYKKRPCEELVGISARIVGEFITFAYQNKSNGL